MIKSVPAERYMKMRSGPYCTGIHPPLKITVKSALFLNTKT